MISENLKRARKVKGISQEEMAVKLNVVRQTVSKWENGLSVPDAEMLLKISVLLEVPVSDLLGIEPKHHTDEDLAQELVRRNRELASRDQERKLAVQAGKKRGLILWLSFAAMLIALVVKNELAAILLISGCVLSALIILYRNLALLTIITTTDMKIGALKITTLFDLAIFVLAIMILIFDKTAVMQMPEGDDRLLALIIISVVILFSGYISPKLPFNRHTGLRLPWTVQDEDTWNVAHKIIGIISLPLVVLYITAFYTIRNFEAVTLTVALLWIGIPGLISLVFWWKKFYGKM